MTIRPARHEDVPALHALLVENALTIDGVPYEAFSQPTLVAEEEGEIRGFIQAFVGAPYAIITEMAVARGHQKRGIGQTLLDHLETVLRLAGVTAWLAYTAEDNDIIPRALDHRGARCLGRGGAWVRHL